MSSEESVTFWIHKLKAGSPDAAEKLWDRYFQRLVSLARKKLSGKRYAATDEEDIALNVLDSVYRGAGQGRFLRLNDRNDLWGLLVLITTRKAINLIKHENRRKRRTVRQNKTKYRAGIAENDVEALLSREPSPDMVAQMADEFRSLLRSLGSLELQSVADWKMEGLTTEEIAGKLGCVPRTVERKLRSIRAIWENEGRHELGRDN